MTQTGRDTAVPGLAKASHKGCASEEAATLEKELKSRQRASGKG
jgi:hypothetical protein